MHDTARETAPCYNHAPLRKSNAVLQPVVLIPWPGARMRAGDHKYAGGDMRFNDPTLYGRDDETDEFSDSGAYGESLEEDLDEEEEEEEEPALVEEDDELPAPPPVREPVAAPAPVTPSGGGGSQSGPPKKKA